jgi:hypothetical protein
MKGISDICCSLLPVGKDGGMITPLSHLSKAERRVAVQIRSELCKAKQVRKKIESELRPTNHHHALVSQTRKKIK